MPPTRPRRSPNTESATRKRSSSRSAPPSSSELRREDGSDIFGRDTKEKLVFDVNADSSPVKCDVDDETILSSIMLGCCQVCGEASYFSSLLLCDGEYTNYY